MIDLGPEKNPAWMIDLSLEKDHVRMIDLGSREGPCLNDWPHSMADLGSEKDHAQIFDHDPEKDHIQWLSSVQSRSGIGRQTKTKHELLRYTGVHNKKKSLRNARYIAITHINMTYNDTLRIS